MSSSTTTRDTPANGDTEASEARPDTNASDDTAPSHDASADTRAMDATGAAAPAAEDEAPRQRRSRRSRVSGGSMRIDPAMIASAVAGVYLLVSGLVAVARGGFAELTLYSPEVTVGGLAHTPLLGLIEIGFGLLVLAAGTLQRDGRAVTFLGVLAMIIGLVWVIEAGAFQQWLAVTDANGWQHVILGVVLAVAGQITPFTLTRSSGADT